MQFDVTLTADDYREAYAPPASGSRWFARWGDLILPVALLAITVPSAFPGHGPFGTPAADRPVVGPRQNLWLTVAPTLFVATWMLATVVVNRWAGGWRPSAIVVGDPAARHRRVGTAVAVGQVVAAGWLSLPLYARWAVWWTPTDGEVLCAAVSPWLLYLALVRLVNRNPSTLLGDRLWSTVRSAGRQRSLVISTDGVTSDDEATATRCQWSYFVRYRETNHLFLLVTEDGGVTMLPKRFVATTPGGEAEPRSLLQTHVAAGTFLPREPRFPVVVDAE